MSCLEHWGRLFTFKSLCSSSLVCSNKIGECLLFFLNFVQENIPVCDGLKKMLFFFSFVYRLKKNNNNNTSMYF